MTVQVKEFELLVEICKHLRAEGSRPELATALQRAINRMHQEQERAWAGNHRPEPAPKWVTARLAKEDAPLMQRLLEAGYPAEEIDHHESDLYIYVTPLTTQVIEQWCREHEYDRAWHCPTFYDQISGRLMYDCAFQYSDWWAEKAKTAP